MAEENSNTKIIYESAGITHSWVDECYSVLLVRENHEVVISEFSEAIMAVAEHLGYKAPLIVDCKYSYSVSAEVMTLAKEVVPLTYSALAYVTYNVLSARISSYEREVLYPDMPVSNFPSMDLAVKWIKEEHLSGPKIPVGTK